MSHLRHKATLAITIDRGIEEVFPALVAAGKVVGKVKEESRLAGYVVIRFPMAIIPPRNATTVRVSARRVNDSQTELSFASESLDGMIGWGEPGKAIDKIIKTLERIL